MLRTVGSEAAVTKKAPSRRSVGATRNRASENAILKATEAILRHEGFDGVSVEAVARLARASKPTIYKWWGSKTQLIFDAYARSMPVSGDDPDLGSVREELRRHFRLLWEHWGDAKTANISRKLLSESLAHPKLLSAYREEYLPRRHKLVLTILQRGIDRGELPRDFNVRTAIDMLFGFHLVRLVCDRPVSADESDHVLDMVLARAGAAAPK